MRSSSLRHPFCRICITTVPCGHRKRTVYQKHLANQQHDKVEMRKKFANLLPVLLVLEYVYLVHFILLGTVKSIPVERRSLFYVFF